MSAPTWKAFAAVAAFALTGLGGVAGGVVAASNWMDAKIATEIGPMREDVREIRRMLWEFLRDARRFPPDASWSGAAGAPPAPPPPGPQPYGR